MEYTDKQKKKLKGILARNGDTTDIKEMYAIENAQIAENLAKNSEELRNIASSISSTYQQVFSEMQKNMIKILESFKTVMEETAKNEKEIKFPDYPDYSGFFKDMPTMLSQIGKNTGNTSELIRNLKWNASQQLRNVNGSPINPAIAPFAISVAYDDIKLSNYDGDGNVGTITYYQAGQIKAVLELTYVGGNLTDVQRTT